MIDRPAFHPCFHAEVVDPDAVFLIAETESYLLKGHLYALVAPLIDGRRTALEIVNQLTGQASMAEVYYALMQLEQKGYITEAAPELPLHEAGFWSSLGTQPGLAGNRLRASAVTITALGSLEAATLVQTLLESAGVRTAAAGNLHLIVADDYLKPELAEANRRALQTGSPWLLVKPAGRVPWFGPLFVPGKTGCWACLAQRLRANREVERFVQEQRRLEGPLVAARAALPATLQAAAGLAATEVSRWLAAGTSTLEGRVLSFDLATWDVQSHTLVRRPQCPVCGEGAAPADRPPRPVVLQPSPRQAGEGRSASSAETLARWSHHISPITGAVRALVRSSDLSDRLVHNYVAGHNLAIPQGSVQRLRQHLRSKSGGKGKTDLHARASGLCEALERYSGLFHGDEPRRSATWAQLGESAIHPNAVMNFSQSQYEQRDQCNRGAPHFHVVPQPFDPGCEIDWSPVWSLTRQTHRYLPTQLLYYGYPSQPGRNFCRADSNGNAAGNTLEEAVLHGLMELVERDSVALWWYNRARRPAVDLASLKDPYVDQLRDRYRAMGRELWVLDLTVDLGIPAFAAISRCPAGPAEAIMMGFGADLNPAEGVVRALTELNQFVLTALSAARETVGDEDSGLLRWWRTATLAAHPYLSPAPGACRSLADCDVICHDDLREAIRFAQAVLERQGLEILVLDQTRPDIGLPVVKVLVPGLRHFWARFGPGRLYDVPVRLGWRPAPTPESELNPVPIFL